MLHEEGLAPAQPTRRAHAARRQLRPPRLAVRLAARLRWFSLDQRLVAGEDPSSSELLTAHAARLTSSRSRDQIAAALAALLRAAEQPARISRVSPDRSAVLLNRSDLEALARRLEGRAAVHAPGVARLERLLADISGPAFTGGAEALAEELSRAAAELGGARPVSRGAPNVSGGAPRRGPNVSGGRPFRVAPRRFVRLVRRGEPGPAIEPPGFVGGSFTLPDGSWFHGRRDSA